MIVNTAQANIKFEWGKFLMMGIGSFVLCKSYILTALTPLPLVISALMFGRFRTGLLAVGILFLYGMATQGEGGSEYPLSVIYGLCIGFAFALAELIQRNLNPVKGIVAIGSVAILIFAGLYGAFVGLSDVSLKQTLVSELERMEPVLTQQRKKMKAAGSAADTQQLEALLENPELMAEKLLREIPGFLMMGIIITLWINLFFALKMSHMLQLKTSSSYTEKDLLHFEMAEEVVWVLIGFLGLYLGGPYLAEDFLGGYAEDIGLTGVKILGVFYFFQGLGIYLLFLDKYRIYGVFRSVLIMLTVLTTSTLLAIVGVVDVFIDIKRKLTVRNEGE